VQPHARADRESGSDSRSLLAAVQEFYERYPYPRPVDNLDDYRARWQDLSRRRADFHLFWPASFYKEDHRILVAGCGTSQAAKHALRWPKASVTGIDVSATSVSCTEDLKRKHDLANLDVRQLPLERVGELRKAFDQIVCTGVLHHLADPDTALRALRDVLARDGAMHLMVYAPYGRAGVYMLQEFCRLVGVAASDDGIRSLVAALEELPARHPLARLLRDAPDFRREGALADALLHPQDRAYSVPQLFEFLEAAGLRFGRWVRQAPYGASCGLMARLPQAAQIAALGPQDQAAAAELFRGTLITHSVVAYRNDAREQAIAFSGDAWLDYVPIRLPDTLCIRERLPPGAAAVLINRAHTSHDVYLPIDAQEHRLLESVDGARRIRDIAGDAHRDAARALFEKLWRHDQIVFDASH
jgi:SAM-dependent methyltransferase